MQAARDVMSVEVSLIIGSEISGKLAFSYRVRSRLPFLGGNDADLVPLRPHYRKRLGLDVAE